MAAAVDALVLRLLAPCDVVRGRVLRTLFPLARELLRDRSRRSALYGALAVVAALALCGTAPLLLLTLGPLVLGVPHLVADLRYLVVRQGLAARSGLWLCVLPWLAFTLVKPDLRSGLAAVAAACLCARAAWPVRLLAIACCASLVLLVQRFSGRAELWFAYAHNLVALAIWALWSRKRARELMPALTLLVLGSVLLYSGALEPWLVRAGGLQPGRWAIDMNQWVARLSPVRDPIWGLRWVLFFAFTQSVHYGVWLRLLPEADRPRPALRSFAASYRALGRELGPWVLPCAAVLLVALWVRASHSVQLGYEGYVRLATFHGPLELAVLALLALERRSIVRAG